MVSKKFRQGCISGLVCLLGVILVLGGLGSQFLQPKVVDFLLKKYLPLKPNESEPISRRFTSDANPLQFSFKVFVFNVTNPYEVQMGLAKPKLSELGPFVFTESRVKENQKFLDDGTKLAFCDKRVYQFNEKESQGSLEDIVTIINVPAISLINAVASNARDGAVELLKSAQKRFPEELGAFLDIKVGDLLFGGRFMAFLDFFEQFKPKSLKFKSLFPNNTFGLFFGKNDTCGPQHQYIVWTGKHDVKKFGFVVEYNNTEEMTYWGSETCNRYQGADGLEFGAETDKSDQKYSFAKELCRTINLDFAEDSFKKGIPTYRFKINPKTLAAPNNSSENACYCLQKSLRNKWCDFGGLVDLSACRQGAPLWASAPHFFQGDPRLLDQVEGLNPEAERHEYFADVEPLTGFTMATARRYQLNAEVNTEALARTNFTDTWFHQDIIFPVTWVDEVVEVSDSCAQDWKDSVGYKVRIANIVSFAAEALGAVLFLGPVVHSVCCGRRRTGRVQISTYEMKHYK